MCLFAQLQKLPQPISSTVVNELQRMNSCNILLYYSYVGFLIENYPRSGEWLSLHLLVTEFETGYLQTLAFGGSVSLT